MYRPRRVHAHNMSDHLHLSSSRITEGGSPPTYRPHWHYNSSTCVTPPPLKSGMVIEKVSYFNANQPPSTFLLIRALHLSTVYACVSR